MRLLLVAHFDPEGILTVKEHLEQIQNLSKNKIEIYNVRFARRKLGRIFPKILLNYEGVIFHNTVTYDLENLMSLDHLFFPKLSQFSGLKILMKQDEMRKVNLCKEILKTWKIDGLLSCVPESELPKVYPPAELPGLNIMLTRTGYVADFMKTTVACPYEDRTVDICYRGMETPFEWGKLGHEKFVIGERFKELSRGLDLKLNISSKNSDRLTGARWIELLQSSRAVLATESGASIFDWTGEIEANCRSLKSANPNISFEEVWEKYLKDFEGNVNYAQISPRHIEAAYTRTLQILFEGSYSGLMRPWVHYVPLKKDFSNFDEVCRAVAEKDLYQRLTSSAFKDLIGSETLSYRKFVSDLDAFIANLAS